MVSYKKKFDFVITHPLPHPLRCLPSPPRDEGKRVTENHSTMEVHNYARCARIESPHPMGGFTEPANDCVAENSPVPTSTHTPVVNSFPVLVIVHCRSHREIISDL